MDPLDAALGRYKRRGENDLVSSKAIVQFVYGARGRRWKTGERIWRWKTKGGSGMGASRYKIDLIALSAQLVLGDLATDEATARPQDVVGQGVAKQLVDALADPIQGLTPYILV